jgi:hypothetical protein
VIRLSLERWSQRCPAIAALIVASAGLVWVGVATGGGLTALRSMPWDPSQYDGVALTADAPDPTTLPTVHAVYLYPSDAPNRFGQYAAMFQRDARRASGFLEDSFGRAIRWDERIGSDGMTPYLDISVIRSKYPTKRLGGGQQFSLVRTELSARGFTNPNKKYLVWLDAPSSFCGQSEAPIESARGPANAAERRTVSAIYRYYPPTDANGGFCSPVLHELAHAMGAVQPSAPHYEAGHCNDNGNDLLCRMASTIPYDAALGGFYYDYGNDDYWDPAADPRSGSSVKLGWWTVNLSRFLCPPAPTPDPSGAARADCTRPNANPGY